MSLKRVSRSFLRGCQRGVGHLSVHAAMRGVRVALVLHVLPSNLPVIHAPTCICALTRPPTPRCPGVQASVDI